MNESAVPVVLALPAPARKFIAYGAHMLVDVGGRTFVDAVNVAYLDLQKLAGIGDIAEVARNLTSALGLERAKLDAADDWLVVNSSGQPLSQKMLRDFVPPEFEVSATLNQPVERVYRRVQSFDGKRLHVQFLDAEGRAQAVTLPRKQGAPMTDYYGISWPQPSSPVYGESPLLDHLKSAISLPFPIPEVMIEGITVPDSPGAQRAEPAIETRPRRKFSKED